MDKMSHYAVIGRESGDDEDTTILVSAPSLEEARSKFLMEMRDPDRPDAEIYITSVLCSDAQIFYLGGDLG